MSLLKEHIIFKILTLSLVLSILAPTGIKFAHIFTHHNHKHDVCIGEKKTHLHEIDVDCEFYKFQLNKSFSFSLTTFGFISIEENFSTIESQYFFVSKFQYLQTALRGPPSLI